MEWGYLVVAGIAEVAFVTFMKLSQGFTRTPYTLLTVLAASISFYLLSLSLLSLPVGTAYAIWTGIGAAGSVIVGMILFKESKNWKRLVFLSLIAVGAIGLKLTATA